VLDGGAGAPAGESLASVAELRDPAATARGLRDPLAQVVEGGSLWDDSAGNLIGRSRSGFAMQEWLTNRLTYAALD
jgi:hypothetical protein